MTNSLIQINQIPKFDNSMQIHRKELIDDHLIEIFKFLNGKEIGIVSQVSRQWKLLTDDRRIWLNLTVHYSLKFQKLHPDFQPSQGFLFDPKINFKQLALRSKTTLLKTPFAEDGIPSVIAKLFGGVDNVLALPRGSVSEEFLKEWNSHFSFVLPQWQDLGDNIQDDSICRIDANGQHFIAIRYVINFPPDFKWEKRDRQTWQRIDKTGGSLESKIVINAGRHFGSENVYWNVTDHSTHDSCTSKAFLDLYNLEEPRTFEWLKKLVSGAPCGIISTKVVWNSFLDRRFRQRPPDHIHLIEGPSLLKDGKSVCQLWTGSKRAMSSLNIIEDYIPKK